MHQKNIEWSVNKFRFSKMTKKSSKSNLREKSSTCFDRLKNTKEILKISTQTQFNKVVSAECVPKSMASYDVLTPKTIKSTRESQQETKIKHQFDELNSQCYFLKLSQLSKKSSQEGIHSDRGNFRICENIQKKGKNDCKNAPQWSVSQAKDHENKICLKLKQESQLPSKENQPLATKILDKNPLEIKNSDWDQIFQSNIESNVNQGQNRSKISNSHLSVLEVERNQRKTVMEGKSGESKSSEINIQGSSFKHLDLIPCEISGKTTKSVLPNPKDIEEFFQNKRYFQEINSEVIDFVQKTQFVKQRLSLLKMRLNRPKKKRHPSIKQGRQLKNKIIKKQLTSEKVKQLIRNDLYSDQSIDKNRLSKNDRLLNVKYAQLFQTAQSNKNDQTNIKVSVSKVRKQVSEKQKAKRRANVLKQIMRSRIYEWFKFTYETQAALFQKYPYLRSGSVVSTQIDSKHLQKQKLKLPIKINRKVPRFKGITDQNRQPVGSLTKARNIRKKESPKCSMQVQTKEIQREPIQISKRTREDMKKDITSYGKSLNRVKRLKQEMQRGLIEGDMIYESDQSSEYRHKQQLDIRQIQQTQQFNIGLTTKNGFNSDPVSRDVQFNDEGLEQILMDGSKEEVRLNQEQMHIIVTPQEFYSTLCDRKADEINSTTGRHRTTDRQSYLPFNNQASASDLECQMHD